MNTSPEDDRRNEEITIRLRGFSVLALEAESLRLGVSVDELAAFAVSYYLADVDSGRIARQPLGTRARHRVPRLTRGRRRQ